MSSLRNLRQRAAREIFSALRESPAGLSDDELLTRSMAAGHSKDVILTVLAYYTRAECEIRQERRDGQRWYRLATVKRWVFEDAAGGWI